MAPPESNEITPQQLQALLAAGPAPVVVDVRESWEVQRCPFPGALHIPLGDLTLRAPQELPPGPHVVAVCHHGVRSLQALYVLRALGHSGVQSLRGGTDAWAQSVDPTMPRY